MQSRITALRHQIDEGILKAPRSAQVLDVWLSSGEQALPGQPAVRLGYLDTVRVIAFVPEPELPTIVVGETLWVRTDAEPNQWMPGLVSWISPKAEYASQYVQTPDNRLDLVFRIHLRVANPRKNLHAGLPVDVARHPTF